MRSLWFPRLPYTTQLISKDFVDSELITISRLLRRDNSLRINVYVQLMFIQALNGTHVCSRQLGSILYTCL